MPQAETILFKRTTIVGPGLLGASIAMGLNDKRFLEKSGHGCVMRRKQMRAENPIGVIVH